VFGGADWQYVGDWTPKGHKASAEEEKQIEAEKKEGKEGNDAFLKVLPPTYLKYDTDGRVIRMDVSRRHFQNEIAPTDFQTFSKTSCPGSRLGWFTTSPLFIERLTRATEAQTQAPSGFATALTTTLLTHWGYDGYIRWLRGIKSTYKQRRDWIIDAIDDNFDLVLDSHAPMDEKRAVYEIEGLGKGATCYSKSSDEKWDEKKGAVMSLKKGKGPALVSFIPPTGRSSSRLLHCPR
jgi:aromatic amino acid aminotransferase I